MSAPLRVLGFDHVQLTCEPEDVPAARHFYLETLGLPETPKPECLIDRGGFWAKVGAQELHVSPEAGINRWETKAHPAFLVDDISAARAALEAAGAKIQESVAIPGIDRFECRDPFGNRLEFLQRS